MTLSFRWFRNTGYLRLPNGTREEPTVSAAAYPTTGLYWASSDQLRAVVEGADFLELQGIGTGKFVFKVFGPNIQFESAEGGTKAQSLEFDDTTATTVNARKLAFRRVDKEIQFRNLSAVTNPIRLDMTAPTNSLYMAPGGEITMGKATVDAGVTNGLEFAGDNIFLTGPDPALVLRDSTDNSQSTIDTATNSVRINADVNGVGAFTIRMRIAGTEHARISQNGVTVGNAGAGDGTNTLALFNGTAPSAGQVNSILLYSKDQTSGNTMLGIRTEGSGAVATGTATVAGTLAVEINGTVRHLMFASAAAA